MMLNHTKTLFLSLFLTTDSQSDKNKLMQKALDKFIKTGKSPKISITYKAHIQSFGREFSKTITEVATSLNFDQFYGEKSSIHVRLCFFDKTPMGEFKDFLNSKGYQLSMSGSGIFIIKS